MTSGTKLSWNLDSLRMIAFGSKFDFRKAKDYWTDLSPEEPQNTQSNASAKQSVYAYASETQQKVMVVAPGQGPLGQTNFCQIQITPQPVQDEFPTLGTWDENVPRFMAQCSKFFNNSAKGQAERMGFLVMLTAYFPSAKEAYGAMKPLLKQIKWDPNADNLVFQINRPKQSTVIKFVVVELVERASGYF